MTEEERLIRQKLKDDLKHYAQKCLKIRTKDSAIVPFQFNKAQLYIDAMLSEQLRRTGKVRALILKGRQQGCSTYVGARFFHKVSHSFGARAFILTHHSDATANLYEMAKRFYEHLPSPVKPEIAINNSKELRFGLLDSGYKVGTAETKEVGRSSTIQYFHGSEVAFWANADVHAKGILQAVPDSASTEIIMESTANGVGNFFHQMWGLAEAGISDYQAIFIPWFWQEEYRRIIPVNFSPSQEEIELQALYGLDFGQLAFRRSKIIDLGVNGTDGEKAFKQEYPCCAAEAFQLTGEDSYIESDLVMKARKTTHSDVVGSLLVGIDPARFGDDRTCIIRRQGRRAYGLETYVKKDTMEVVGLIHRIIETEKPTRVFVDIGGLGAGIVDRLFELGHRGIVVGTNAGAKPLDSQKYYNKRAEMWGLVKEWLKDEPCQIPDNDALHADLCGTKYTIDSNSRLRMESKQDMKKRGVRSSDSADALCLTFALPESALQQRKHSEEIAQKFDQELTRKLTATTRMYSYGDANR